MKFENLFAIFLIVISIAFTALAGPIKMQDADRQGFYSFTSNLK